MVDKFKLLFKTEPKYISISHYVDESKCSAFAYQSDYSQWEERIDRVPLSDMVRLHDRLMKRGWIWEGIHTFVGSNWLMRCCYYRLPQSPSKAYELKATVETGTYY